MTSKICSWCQILIQDVRTRADVETLLVSYCLSGDCFGLEVVSGSSRKDLVSINAALRLSTAWV